MTIDKAATKIIFGLIIFMFSLALAYFTATYVNRINAFDYWLTLLVFAVIYIIVGMIVYQIFPVSLGFLFSADILIFNLLLENFGDITNIIKMSIIGVVLVILYMFAWTNMKDQIPDIPVPKPPEPMPPDAQ